MSTRATIIHRRDVDDLFATRCSIAAATSQQRRHRKVLSRRLMVNISDGLGLEGRRPRARSLFNANGGKARLIMTMRAAAASSPPSRLIYGLSRVHS